MLVIDKDLYCPNALLAVVLGTSLDALKHLAACHRHELHPLIGRKSPAKVLELLAMHKDSFHIKRLRDDIILWPEDDMILLACMSQTPIGHDFRRWMVAHIKENASRSAITIERVEQILTEKTTAIRVECQDKLDEMQKQLDELRDVRAALFPTVSSLLSNAGSSLNLGRKLKAVRDN
jgi:prophage antirepressor-like protein